MLKETEEFIYENEDEKVLGDLIVKVFKRNNEAIPSGMFADMQVELALASFQMSCSHEGETVCLKDVDGVKRKICCDCAAIIE